MGKFVYIFNRSQQDWDDQRKIVEQCLKTPVSEPYTQISQHEFLWISNPNGILLDNFSIATGVLNFETSVQQLNHFSFRMIHEEETVFLESDVTGSRIAWYFINEEQFIVSSSQRVIIALLQDFIINPQAISWMLCTGSLGPNNAWDKRISCVGPNRRITFNKKDFSITTLVRQTPHTNASLEEIIDEVFGEFNPADSWGVTLSGGVDSRALLFQLVNRKISVESFTWGLASSMLDRTSDASVAREVANDFQVPFTFMELDSFPIHPTSLDIFLTHGEGRVDHINSFIDGLANWKALSEKKIKGIIRADEAFGWIKSETEREVRISLDLNLPGDYENLNAIFANSQQLETPLWPEEFNRLAEESIEDWRDRLYRSYRIPFILSALHDPVLDYFEIVNPFLHHQFISWAISQKGKDRSNKLKFNRYIKRFIGKIPFSKKPSIPEPEEIFLYPGFQEEIKRILQSKDAIEIFGEKTAGLLAKTTKLESIQPLKSRIGFVSRLIPFRIKKIVRRTIIPYQLKQSRISLRAFIIIAMRNKVLEDIENAKRITSH